MQEFYEEGSNVYFALKKEREREGEKTDKFKSLLRVKRGW